MTKPKSVKSNLKLPKGKMDDSIWIITDDAGHPIITGNPGEYLMTDRKGNWSWLSLK